MRFFPEVLNIPNPSISVKSFGFFVELQENMIEGLVPQRTFPHDFWHLDDLEMRLQGRRSKKDFRLGDIVKIKVLEVNRLKRQITFRYLSHLGK